MSTKHYRTENAAVSIVEGVRWIVYDNVAGVTPGVFATDNPELQKEIGKATGVHAINEAEYNKLLEHTALTERLEKEQEQLDKAQAPSAKEAKAEAKAELEDKASEFADRTRLDQAKADAKK